MSLDKINSLQQKITSNIPITGSMGLKVLACDKNSLSLYAPLELNKNDKQTAFAGSLFSIVVLTGWAYIYQRLTDEGLNVETAVFKSNITYHKPVTSDYTAICKFDNEVEWTKFKERVAGKSNGKITLSVEINQNEELKVSFTGEYYAWIKK